MIENFNFSKVPRIIFGPAKIVMLADEVKKFGSKILLVTGEKSLSKFIDKNVIKNLTEQSLEVSVEKIGQEPNPSIIDTLAEKYRNKDIDVIIAIGGGSVIDSGKAISAMIKVNDSITNYLEGIGTKSHPGEKVPFIAIPSTSGTGSEVTSNAVISDVNENGYKRSLRHDNFIPEIAIIDPEITISCSPEITAASGMDAFSQLLESYVSTKANVLTDAITFTGIKAIKDSIATAFLDGKNIASRTGMSYASMISGMALTNVGLGVVHGFASSIGGFFKIPHGILCGSLMAPANKITLENLLENDPKNPAVEKYLNIARLFSEAELKKPEDYFQNFIDKLEVFTDLFKLPKLSTYGIKENDFDKIVEVTSNKNNPYQLNNNELKKILKSRL